MVYEADATVYVPISLSCSLSQKQLCHVCVSAPSLDCTVTVMMIGSCMIRRQQEAMIPGEEGLVMMQRRHS